MLRQTWAFRFIQVFPTDSVVKNPPTIQESMQETMVPSLGREDPLEKEMATHSSILACRIPWTEEPDGLQSIQLKQLSSQASLT